jgi:CTD small phosphatase-like protein 2
MLVDNSPHAYGYHPDNGIPIESWFDDDADTELLKLGTFLNGLEDVDDVRPVIREHFKTYQLVDKARRGVSVSLSAPPF